MNKRKIPSRIKATKAERVYQIITGVILAILLILCMYPLIYVLGASFMTEAESRHISRCSDNRICIKQSAFPSCVCLWGLSAPPSAI